MGVPYKQRPPLLRRTAQEFLLPWADEQMEYSGYFRFFNNLFGIDLSGFFGFAATSGRMEQHLGGGG
jgi:hypothetical protein